MKRGVAASLVAFLLMGVLLASCGPAAKPTPAPAPTQPAAPQAPAKSGAPAPAVPAAKPKLVELNVPTGPVNSTAYRQCIALSEVLRKHNSFVRLSPMAVTGYGEAGEMYLKGMAKFFWFSADKIQEITTATGSFAKSKPVAKDAIGIAFIYGMIDAFVVARADSPINSVKDLKGRKVGVTAPGSMGYMMGLRMAEANGFDMVKDSKTIFGTYADLVAAMKEGSVEAWINPHVYTPGSPYPYLEDVANSVKLRYISLTPEEIAKINKLSGADVYVLNSIPAGSYKGQTAPVKWMSAAGTPSAAKELGEDVVYEIVKTWFNYFDELVEVSAVVTSGDAEICKKMLKEKLPGTWHPGAMKYFKEVGWVK